MSTVNYTLSTIQLKNNVYYNYCTKLYNMNFHSIPYCNLALYAKNNWLMHGTDLYTLYQHNNSKVAISCSYRIFNARSSELWDVFLTFWLDNVIVLLYVCCYVYVLLFCCTFSFVLPGIQLSGWVLLSLDFLSFPAKLYTVCCLSLN